MCSIKIFGETAGVNGSTDCISCSWAAKGQEGVVKNPLLYRASNIQAWHCFASHKMILTMKLYHHMVIWWGNYDNDLLGVKNREENRWSNAYGYLCIYSTNIYSYHMEPGTG